jgi:hypothetical protein
MKAEEAPKAKRKMASIIVVTQKQSKAWLHAAHCSVLPSYARRKRDEETEHDSKDKMFCSANSNT